MNYLKIFLISISLSFTQFHCKGLESFHFQTDSLSFTMQKSPSVAMLKSALIPGWGQFYTESYWKIPVIWGFLGYYVYGYIRQNDKYNQFSSLYLEALNNNSSVASNYKLIRNFYRDSRDSFIIYFGIAYLLNILDAYVNAHMFDFDVSTDIFGNSKTEINFKIGF